MSLFGTHTPHSIRAVTQVNAVFPLIVGPRLSVVKNALVFYTDISKYLRHSVATAAKHYNFGAIEENARDREAVVQLIGSSSNDRAG